MESLIQEEILDEADVTRNRELRGKVSIAKAKVQRMRSIETRGPQSPISQSAEVRPAVVYNRLRSLRKDFTPKHKFTLENFSNDCRKLLLDCNCFA